MRREGRGAGDAGLVARRGVDLDLGLAVRLGRALAPLAALAYAGWLLARGGGFLVSEDFLLLRFLADNPPWADLTATLTEPWLGIAAVRFWRPISTTLLAAEGAGLGANPWSLQILHVAVHLACIALVARLAGALQGSPGAGPGAARRARAIAGWTTAAVFAAYPWLPNAVLFVGSFATLFGSAFLLGALVVWARAVREDSGRSALGALGLWVAALGSYEATLIGPALAGLVALSLAGTARATAGRVARWLAGAAGLAVAYLAWRRHLFGDVLGGYPATADGLRGDALIDRLVALPRSLAGLLSAGDAQPSGDVQAFLLAGLALATGATLLSRQPRAGRGATLVSALAAALLGPLWALLALAPFGFAPLVGATGRYGYLAAAGAALAAGGWAGALAAWARRGDPGREAAGSSGAVPWRPVATVLGAALLLTGGGVWAVRLDAELAAFREAGQAARAIQRAATEWLSANPGAGRPTALDGAVLVGAPPFLLGPGGEPRAQILHYGLADALRAPFAPAGGAAPRRVLTLGAAGGPWDGFIEALGEGGLSVACGVWNGAAGRFDTCPATRRAAGADPGRLEIAGGPDCAASDGVGIRWRGTVPAGIAPEAIRAALGIAAAGNGHRVDARALPGAASEAFPESEEASGPAGPWVAAWPRDFVDTMRRLYPGAPILRWAEARAANGALLAVAPAEPCLALPLGAAASPQ